LLVTQLVELYGSAFRYYGYLLGHIDGCEQKFELDAATAVEVIINAGMEELFQRLTNGLRSLYESFGQWSGTQELTPLTELARDLLCFAGIEFQTRLEGEYINVPFTPETKPTF